MAKKLTIDDVQIQIDTLEDARFDLEDVNWNFEQAKDGLLDIRATKLDKDDREQFIEARKAINHLAAKYQKREDAIERKLNKLQDQEDQLRRAGCDHEATKHVCLDCGAEVVKK